jgi:hypothetical protein
MFAVDQGINQAGFSHVGTTGKGNLRQPDRGVLRGFGGAGDKFGRCDFHEYWVSGIWVMVIFILDTG